MLKIHYGNEATQKEKYLFDHIDPERKTILLVPDQYSLQMERDALAHFRGRHSALLNFMVADFSSLGRKVVKASACKEPELIDKYGRHMLLALLIDKLSGDLSIYKRMSGRNSFTALMNQLISEMKRYGTKPSDLSGVFEDGTAHSYLEYKLEDIERIYRAYEEAVDGKFLDSEDYIRFFGDLIRDAELVRGADIWVYGFDTFTPLNILVLQRLLQSAGDLHVIMTCEYAGDSSPETPMDARKLTVGEGEGLFDLPRRVIQQLVNMADEAGQNSSIEPIMDVRERAFAPVVELAETSNIYAEAERAAAYILGLVRDEGYRFGDIALICNDMDVRGRVLLRTLHRWGIPAFADQKRSVLHQPVVRFLLSLLDIMVRGFVSENIMSLVKTGLLGWSRGDEELLQNYVEEFRIRSNKWKEPFTLMGDVYTEEELRRLNEMRAEIVEIVQTSKDETGRRNTAEEKVRGIYNYLEKRFAIRDRIGGIIEQQNEMGLVEGAAETAQSWNLICSLFTQIVRVIGEQRISNDTLRSLIGAGLEEAEIGLVPQSSDCVLIGTMQRTRMSRIKVLMVAGANEGVLPIQSGETGLLTEKELARLEDLNVRIAKREEVTRQEEQLAIYRNLSLPTDRLYMSYSLADENGKGSSPSSLFSELKDMLGVPVMGDIGQHDEMEKITSPKGTLPYMAGAMRDYIESSKIDSTWLATMQWYEEHDEEDLRRIVSGLQFSNRLEALGQEMADALYCGDSDRMFVSASRLERYSECPFKHFVDRGLRADEQRVFEIGGREIGDVYHECLMKLSQKLTPADGASVTAATSPWMNVTREECDELVKGIIIEEADGYREGIFDANAEGRFRRDRIVSICSEVAWALVQQVRGSRIRSMRFEEPFGFSGNALPPIKVQLSGGKEAWLRGKIDRMDVLDVPGGGSLGNGAVSIVDYKSGNNQINTDEIKSGYKLQLMVYMNAARQAEETELEPAGVFYFKIREQTADAEGTADGDDTREAAEKKLKEGYVMEGITIDDKRLFQAFDGPFYREASEGNSCKSTTIPIKHAKTKDVYSALGNSELLSESDFKELCDITTQQVERICREIYEGRIDIAPKREKKGKDANGARRNACTYCGYRSICMFDTTFDGCRYTEV
ncbi:MAG: PD-(D/E)XK nuclease family protein [Firmicutes bacterium]|nr:PD-(D/E)XK nuclease family protein [Bacillota bacterium]